jgi:hypothetical protein
MAVISTVTNLPQLQKANWQPKRRPVPDVPRKDKPRIQPVKVMETVAPPPPRSRTKPRVRDGAFRVVVPIGSPTVVITTPRRTPPIQKVPSQIQAKPKPLTAVPIPLTSPIVPIKPRTKNIARADERELNEDVRHIFDRTI